MSASMSRRAATLAAAAVIASASCHGPAKAAGTMEEAYKACEHLIGFPNCYGACTKWYTTENPWEDEDLIDRAEQCYDEDNRWDAFRPVEEVVVTGTRITVNLGTGLGGGDTDTAVDPLEGFGLGGRGLGRMEHSGRPSRGEPATVSCDNGCREFGVPYDFTTHQWTVWFRDPNAPRKGSVHD